VWRPSFGVVDTAKNFFRIEFHLKRNPSVYKIGAPFANTTARVGGYGDLILVDTMKDVHPKRNYVSKSTRAEIGTRVRVYYKHKIGAPFANTIYC